MWRDDVGRLALSEVCVGVLSSRGLRSCAAFAYSGTMLNDDVDF